MAGCGRDGRPAAGAPGGARPIRCSRCTWTEACDLRDAIAIAKALPQVDVSTWYGTPGLKVAAKGFARLRTEAEGGSC